MNDAPRTREVMDSEDVRRDPRGAEAAWDAVAATLSKLSPGWSDAARSGLRAAVRTIEDMADEKEMYREQYGAARVEVAELFEEVRRARAALERLRAHSADPAVHAEVDQYFAKIKMQAA